MHKFIFIPNTYWWHLSGHRWCRSWPHMCDVHQKRWPRSWRRWHTGSRASDPASATRGGSVTSGHWTSEVGQCPPPSSCWSHMHPAHRTLSHSDKGFRSEIGESSYHYSAIALRCSQGKSYPIGLHPLHQPYATRDDDRKTAEENGTTSSDVSIIILFTINNID